MQCLLVAWDNICVLHAACNIADLIEPKLWADFDWSGRLRIVILRLMLHILVSVRETGILNVGCCWHR